MKLDQGQQMYKGTKRRLVHFWKRLIWS